MIRNLALALLLALAASVGSAEDDGPACHRGPTVATVEAQRESFNEAIRRGDLEPIDRILADDVVLIAGTHSDRFTGKQAQLDIWRSDFARAAERLVYRRTPSCIRLSSIRPMALEHGRWRGENDNGDFAAGRYSAKWRRIGGEWKIEAEVFMTERCGGSACP